jgi:hypothetical protein
MIANVLILIVSCALFLYWFRYTCVLILSAKPVRDYTLAVAAANNLQFLEVQRRLEESVANLHLDQLGRMLERDYRLLTYLIRHGANFRPSTDVIERKMLMLHFQIMRITYRVSCHLSNSWGRNSIREMSLIVGHFANVMGERAACAS